MIVLGISAEHDSGAALVIDGKISAAANEERFSRKKFYSGFPHQALRTVLETAGVGPAEIDAVALSSFLHVPELDWQQKAQLIQVGMEWLSRAGLARYVVGHKPGVDLACTVLRAMALPRKRKIKRLLESEKITAPLSVIDHHISHLASCYFTSGWNRCVAMSLDAQGDGYCCKIALCEDGKLTLLHSIPFFHSPGYYYAYVTAILGFKPRRDGKVTGLAANGNAQKTIDIFRSRITYDSAKMRFDNRGTYWSAEIATLKHLLEGHSPEDIAAGVQEQMEAVVTNCLRDVLRKHSLNDENLALAGGVFANVKLNQRLAAMAGISELYVFPHMGDGGLPAGSALTLTAEILESRGKRLKPSRLDHAYLGPSFGNGRIRRDLEAAGCRYSKPECIDEEIASLVAADKVVARFRGAMEYGPRALGHRSILASPVDPTINTRLNKRLKRTEFMPFAPVILSEHAAEFFTGLSKVVRSLPFMTVTCDVTDKCRRKAAGIVHTDGTARPQVVTREHAPEMHRILMAYYRLTGLPLMINTSFNIHEEPIVSAPAEAIAAWREGKLDALAIGEYLVHE